MLAMLLLTPALVTGLTQISIENFAFVPDSVRVQPGDTVRWTNKDGSTHTSTGTGSGAAAWNSGNLSPNSTFQRVFGTPGTFDYRCNIHTSMQGKVSVGGATGILRGPGEAAAPKTEESSRDVRGRAINPEKKAVTPASPVFPAR
jgi:plastocyanin